jgi:D-glycero-alpha-D-manno-heptose-7-phosphate kinase
MIVAKTPMRISFFGGGTDFPEVINQLGKGVVIGGAIDKFVYVASTKLVEGIHDFSLGINYSKIEKVNLIEEVKFRPFRRALEKSIIEINHEYHLMSDLPSMTGLGTSSAFIVSLINVGAMQKNLKLNPMELTNRSIKFERGDMGESGGIQDQHFAALGGFQKFTWDKDLNLQCLKYNRSMLQDLEKWIILVNTKITRISHNVIQSQIEKIDKNLFYLNELMDIAELGSKLLESSKFKEVGELLSKSWEIKMKLGNDISNSDIDNLYSEIMKSGAAGAKLLGAGAGGYFLVLIPPHLRNKFIEKFRKQGLVSVNFVDSGSTVMSL